MLHAPLENERLVAITYSPRAVDNSVDSRVDGWVLTPHSGWIARSILTVSVLFARSIFDRRFLFVFSFGDFSAPASVKFTSDVEEGFEQDPIATQ